MLGTGLHSYGFGAGGLGYAGAFAAFELAIVACGAAVWRRRHAVAVVTARALPARA